MVEFANRAKMTTATTGTGTLTLGSAVDGYQTFAAAGISDGDSVRYIIEDDNDWEIGTGTYTASGTTLSRSVIESSNSDSAISLSGNAEVYIGLAAEDVDGGGGLIPISKTTASNDSAVDISLTGGYSAYLLRITQLTMDTPLNIVLQVSTDGGTSFDAGASHYSYGYLALETTAMRDEGAMTAAHIPLTHNVSFSGASYDFNAAINIIPGDGTRYTTVMANSDFFDSYINLSIVSGRRLSTTAATDIRITLSSTGNIATGTFHLYGIADGDA